MSKSLIVVIFILSGIAFCQNRPEKNTGHLSGKVYDYNTKVPVEYANVILFKSSDSTQVTGTISNKQGNFDLSGISDGKYYLTVQFIGFQKHVIENLAINNSSKNIDVGKVFLKPTSVNLTDVVVEGERSPITYQIDKKVINVDQMQTVISGNAADVLENVPSVSVDIDGNVSLRGSTSFTVLIDGKPSVIDAQDILQQIPASSISTMEIITNPSAKFDPEGNAGIINIKLKKNKNYGLSGIINGNSGINDKYGGDFLFEHKTESANYNFGVDYNRRFSPGDTRSSKWFDLGDNISYLNSNGNQERGRISFGIKGGIDLNLSDNDLLTFGGRFGTRDRQNNEALNYSQSTSNDPLVSFYLSNNNRQRSGTFFALNSNYQHDFSQKGHKIYAELFGSYHNSDESTFSSESQNGAQFSGRKTTEAGPSRELRGKIDYSLPISETSKYEAGSQGEVDISEDNNGYFEYNPQSNSYDFIGQFSNSTKYNRSELAIYSIYSNEWNNFEFQWGIRTEYTYRTIDFNSASQTFSIDRWDFFPGMHTSYKFSQATQVMASYTRRIDRPHGWHLEPFYSWIDANNIRIGNPSLQPEFIDSYELNFQTILGNMTLSNDIYYRINHNRIEDVRSVYSDNVTLTTFENVGTDYSLGSEFMVTLNPIEAWNLNFMGNLYDYKIKGSLNGETFDRNSFNWRIRINNGIKIGEFTQFQINARYNGPTVEAQGRREGYFRTDVSIKQDVLDRQLSFTLQIRDIFKTAKYEGVTQGIDFYTYSFHNHEAPMVMLNVRLNLNNYKSQERVDQNIPDDNGEQPQEF